MMNFRRLLSNTRVSGAFGGLFDAIYTLDTTGGYL